MIASFVAMGADKIITRQQVIVVIGCLTITSDRYLEWNADGCVYSTRNCRLPVPSDEAKGQRKRNSEIMIQR